MTLQVERIRDVDTGQVDRYNKPIFAPQSTDHTAHAFAPVVAGDVKGVDSIISSDGGTLYFRAPNLVDAQPGDEFVVRGVTYQSEGREALWEAPDGTQKGTVVVLKRTEPTDG